MLFVQVILGGGAVVLRFPQGYHLIWGVLTFVVLLSATFIIARDYGVRSKILRVAALAILDFVIQGFLGLAAFGSAVAIVAHLANAFVLAALATWLILLASTTAGYTL